MELLFTLEFQYLKVNSSALKQRNKLSQYEREARLNQFFLKNKTKKA
jgi:hypothetical protein